MVIDKRIVAVLAIALAGCSSQHKVPETQDIPPLHQAISDKIQPTLPEGFPLKIDGPDADIQVEVGSTDKDITAEQSIEIIDAMQEVLNREIPVNGLAQLKFDGKVDGVPVHSILTESADSPREGHVLPTNKEWEKTAPFVKNLKGTGSEMYFFGTESGIYPIRNASTPEECVLALRTISEKAVAFPEEIDPFFGVDQDLEGCSPDAANFVIKAKSSQISKYFDSMADIVEDEEAREGIDKMAADPDGNLYIKAPAAYEISKLQPLWPHGNVEFSTSW